MEHFYSAWGVFGSFIVTGLIAAALAYPANCSYTSGGREVSCGDYTACTSEVQRSFGVDPSSISCETIFGGPPFTDQRGPALVIAFIASVVVALILAGLGHRAKQHEH
jgi:hypothetical protein